MGIPGGWELILVVVAVLIIFGAKKIPEFGKGLGAGIKNFKNAIKDDSKKDISSIKDESKKNDDKENV